MAVCSTCELHAESTFRVEGMDCREEVEMLERRFRNLPGLEGFTADLMAQRIHDHIAQQLDRLTGLPLADLLAKRYQRLLSYGS